VPENEHSISKLRACWFWACPETLRSDAATTAAKAVVAPIPFFRVPPQDCSKLPWGISLVLSQRASKLYGPTRASRRRNSRLLCCLDRDDKVRFGTQFPGLLIGR
jgi:hypothetical protein